MVNATGEVASLQEIIQLLLNEVSALKQRMDIVDACPPVLSEWIPEPEALILTKKGRSTLNNWRKSGVLIEGVHWKKRGGAVDYNRRALGHWVQHRHRPEVHADWLVVEFGQKTKELA
jgi:hypothetical protein